MRANWIVQKPIRDDPKIFFICYHWSDSIGFSIHVHAHELLNSQYKYH